MGHPHYGLPESDLARSIRVAREAYEAVRDYVTNVEEQDIPNPQKFGRPKFDLAAPIRRGCEQQETSEPSLLANTPSTTNKIPSNTHTATTEQLVSSTSLFGGKESRRGAPDSESPSTSSARNRQPKFAPTEPKGAPFGGGVRMLRQNPLHLAKEKIHNVLNLGRELNQSLA